MYPISIAKSKQLHISQAETTHCQKKLREIPMWTIVARTKRRGVRKIPTPTSFGSAPPLPTSEFGAFRHGFFLQCMQICEGQVNLIVNKSGILEPIMCCNDCHLLFKDNSVPRVEKMGQMKGG